MILSVIITTRIFCGFGGFNFVVQGHMSETLTVILDQAAALGI